LMGKQLCGKHGCNDVIKPITTGEQIETYDPAII
jgi:hypothetical protein